MLEGADFWHDIYTYFGQYIYDRSKDLIQDETLKNDISGIIKVREAYFLTTINKKLNTPVNGWGGVSDYMNRFIEFRRDFGQYEFAQLLINLMKNRLVIEYDSKRTIQND